MDWWSAIGVCVDLQGRLRTGTAPRPQPRAILPNERLLREGQVAVSELRAMWANPDFELMSIDDFPLSLPKSDLGSTDFRWRSVTVAHALAAGLARAAAEAGVTIEDLVRTAIIAVLQHATQRVSISMWTEHRRELAGGAFGPYSYSHAFTVRIADAPSLAERLHAVRTVREAANATRCVPLELLWKAVGRDRNWLGNSAGGLTLPPATPNAGFSIADVWPLGENQPGSGTCSSIPGRLPPDWVSVRRLRQRAAAPK